MTAVDVVSAAAAMLVRVTMSRMAAAREAWRPAVRAMERDIYSGAHPFLTVDRVGMIPPQHALHSRKALGQQRCSCLVLVHVSQERRKIQHGREGLRVARPYGSSPAFESINIQGTRLFKMALRFQETGQIIDAAQGVRVARP